ncbi:MAG: hypothetical protein EOL90_05015 [Spartobacteria bacterium]|nr:hypothetical protein [Spartobacteria bacterium]
MRRVLHALLAGLLAATAASGAEPSPPSNDEHDPGRALIVLAAPNATDAYYRARRRDVLDFQIAYAKSILGRDNVVVLCDRPTLAELAGELPDDVLLVGPMRDVWMRDFTPVLPARPVLFRYSAAAQAGKQLEADWVQAGFTRYAKSTGLEFRRSPYVLDGGNLVDDGDARAIVTDRFLADNGLDKPQAVAVLREALGVDSVAILPADPEDRLGHADGMVAFIAKNVLAATRHDEPFRSAVLGELRAAFPDVEIVEIEFPAGGPPAVDAAFGSAHGLYVNAVVTARHVYLPTFGIPEDAAALELLRARSDREIVPVDARPVADLGGSVRCLSGQFQGENARKLIEAARAR